LKDIQDESVFPKERLAALCDGIFAITMTLMILDLKAPGNIPKNLINEELPGALYNLLPAFEAYIVSFIVLAIFWARHQLQFSFFNSVNRIILMINVIFLFMIGFVPFTVGLKVDYPESQFAFLIYLGNLFGITILLSLQWGYSVKNKLIINNELDHYLKKRFFLMSIIPILVFTLSFIVSFIHLRLAFLFIYLIPILYTISKKFVRENN